MHVLTPLAVVLSQYAGPVRIHRDTVAGGNLPGDNHPGDTVHIQLGTVREGEDSPAVGVGIPGVLHMAVEARRMGQMDETCLKTTQTHVGNIFKLLCRC